MSPIGFRGNCWAPQRTETLLFRRLIPLSPGGLLFSRAHFCFAGRRDSRRLNLICQGRFFLRANQRTLAVSPWFTVRVVQSRDVAFSKHRHRLERTPYQVSVQIRAQTAGHKSTSAYEKGCGDRRPETNHQTATSDEGNPQTVTRKSVRDRAVEPEAEVVKGVRGGCFGPPSPNDAGSNRTGQF
jgi:hypothetical protein